MAANEPLTTSSHWSSV